MTAITPKKTYVLIWLALLVLLFATWGFSRVDLTPFNIVIALAISFAKMILIILYFMHVRSSSRLVWVIASAGFVWLLIFVQLTLADYLTRHASGSP